MQETKNNRDLQTGRSTTDRVPPRLYRLLIGFVAWFALSAWIFAGTGPTDYLLFIVSGFISIVVLLQLILSRVGPRDMPTKSADEPPRFSDC